MKNKKVLLLVFVLAFVVLMSGAYVLYTQLGDRVETDRLSMQQEQQLPQREKEEETKRSLVPDFTVVDRDGNEVRLSQYKGKPVVLNFWASWCGPCQMEMPDFQEKYLELGEDVQFMMVNMTSGRETLEKAKAFLQESGYTFPVFFDVMEDAAKTYGVYSLPTTYFIDAEGYGVAQATGAIDAATLQQGIDMITGP